MPLSQIAEHRRVLRAMLKVADDVKGVVGIDAQHNRYEYSAALLKALEALERMARE
jgi:hypothetical protein